jgi:hypothetical protein
MNATESENVRSHEQVLAGRDQAATALHEAELALHDAHQTHVDEWIQATSDRLHAAVVRYVAAEELAKQLQLAVAA